MAFTDKEIEFIKDHSDLIDRGPEGLKELFSKLSYVPGISRLRIIFIYNCLGTEPFKVINTTEVLKGIITGALFNRTSAKAKGIPLLPAMFKNKTKVVLFNIKHGKIVDQKQYTLVDKQSLDDESLRGGYNLCVLDTPEHLNSVKSCFDGNLVYISQVVLEPKELSSPEFRPRVEAISNSANLAKQSILKQLREYLNIKLTGFDKVIDSLMDHIEPQIVF